MPLFRRGSRDPGREEAHLPSPLNRGGAIAHTGLGADLAHMRVDRVDGDIELVRDLGPGQVRRQISQDAELARAELLGWLCVAAQRWRASQQVDDLGAK